MKTEKNFKTEKMLKFTQFVTFRELWGKSTFLKIAAEAFGAEDFLNIFLSFWGFLGSFSYKKFSYIKNVQSLWGEEKSPKSIEKNDALLHFSREE